MDGCCPPTAHGPATSFTGELKGEYQTWTLDGKEVQVYVTGSKDAEKTVVFFPDIFGIKHGRVCANADFLAERGLHVLVPDTHFGDPVPFEVWGPNFMEYFGPWL